MEAMRTWRNANARKLNSLRGQPLSFMFAAAMLAYNAWTVAIDPRPSLSPAFAVNTGSLASSLAALALLLSGLPSKRRAYMTIARWLICSAVLFSALTYPHLVKASLPPNLEYLGYRTEVIMKGWVALMIVILAAASTL